ncbi:Protein required for ethanol metabolism [Rhodotorula toruloides]
MANLLWAYNSALMRRPYATGMASAAFLFGAGDVLAQQGIEKRGADHDYMRTLRLAGYGGLIFAPLITRVYGGIERIRFQSKVATTVARVGVDQFVLTPCVLTLFFTCQSLLEGKGFSEARNRIENKWWPTIQKNWGTWIPVQLINFSVVPLHLRLLVVNVVSLFWNAYLSYANAQGAPKDHVKEIMGEVA